jgi:hypothetical protein
LIALQGPIGACGLEGGAVEGEPAQVGPAQRIVERGGELRLGIEVGKIDDDRCVLGHDGVAVPDRRHFSERIDRQEGGRAMLTGFHVERAQFVVRPKLFQQCQDSRRASARRVVQRDVAWVGHERVGRWVVLVRTAWRTQARIVRKRIESSRRAMSASRSVTERGHSVSGPIRRCANGGHELAGGDRALEQL